MENSELIKKLNWRYAVKRFDPDRKISDEDWRVLEQSLILSPSSYGLQPWKFYVVTDPETREDLRAHSFDQPQIVEGSHLVVIAAKRDAGTADIERLIDRIVEVRGTERSELEVLKGMMLSSQEYARESGHLNEWAARQCFIALGFLLSAAAMTGIDACPMEGFVPEQYDKRLGIADDGYFAVVACTLGYRNEKEDWLSNLSKVRYEESELLKRI
jgi:nitroreductase